MTTLIVRASIDLYDESDSVVVPDFDCTFRVAVRAGGYWHVDAVEYRRVRMTPMGNRICMMSSVTRKSHTAETFAAVVWRSAMRHAATDRFLTQVLDEIDTHHADAGARRADAAHDKAVSRALTD
jgi:Mn-dependent DtxR family transcriptional regulator